MRVLIVEDDAALGLFLQKGLEIEGHDVILVGDGDAALLELAESRPDLMVLDLSLPRKDGIEVLEAIGGRGDGTAVIVLTGRSDVSERVKCLNLGADDCLIKPFSFFELTARCRALLRRRERSANPVLRHGGLELNRLERTVSREGVAIDLTGKEFALLEFLLQHRGQTCSRTELLDRVWQTSPAAGTNVVDVYINYLRKKLAAALGTSGRGEELIETVRGEGYVLGGPKGAQSRTSGFSLRAVAMHG